jgi:hypothetical protein
MYGRSGESISIFEPEMAYLTMIPSTGPDQTGLRKFFSCRHFYPPVSFCGGGTGVTALDGLAGVTVMPAPAAGVAPPASVTL